jgi:hypothetical protein
MTNINLATATAAELATIGYTLEVKKSQAKTRRTRKSAFGVRPSMNNARHAAPVKAQFGSEAGSKIQN